MARELNSLQQVMKAPSLLDLSYSRNTASLCPASQWGSSVSQMACPGSQHREIKNGSDQQLLVVWSF